ncbi:hypothetical protein LguiA_010950 [Lonicera macranthoides]
MLFIFLPLATLWNNLELLSHSITPLTLAFWCQDTSSLTSNSSNFLLNAPLSNLSSSFKFKEESTLSNSSIRFKIAFFFKSNIPKHLFVPLSNLSFHIPQFQHEFISLPTLMHT